ncbi:hypothetical protein SCLCIDRAFT_558206 [Scleroderma citrinum Foug A]|uniref:Uncharacterized protein n=1 Tax=Scleroderma citrinum Foug A TaxID=1036808 RepID=A0A0C3CV31_9AGAM|nr:hypothetical protein SCLCIDRAFT_558206 [Scleroderma citrinum Foug A]
MKVFSVRYCRKPNTHRNRVYHSDTRQWIPFTCSCEATEGFVVRQRYAYHNEDNGSLASSLAGHVYPIDNLETDGRERRDRLRNVRRGIRRWLDWQL